MTTGSTRRIDHFDPLLRDLVSWGLAERDPSAEGAWRLTEAAQTRLEELALRRQVASEGTLVYLGHRCGRCGQTGLTRLVRGTYLCDVCRPASSSGARTGSVAANGSRPSRRRGKARSAPLAG